MLRELLICDSGLIGPETSDLRDEDRGVKQTAGSLDGVHAEGDERPLCRFYRQPK